MPESVAIALLGAALAILAGLALVGTGGVLGIALLAAIAVVGLLPFVTALGRFALPVWIAVFGLLYPFIRIPAGGPVATFDRLFLGALLISYVLSHRRRGSARESAWLQASFLILAAVFLLSALSGGEGASGNLAIWTDAFALPLVLFWVAREAARERARLIAIAGALALAGASIAAVGLAQKFAGLDLTSFFGSVERFDAAIGDVRISGPFPAPEPFALVLLGCLAGTVLWMRCRGASAIVPGGLALCLQLAAIFFTYFRAAWLGAVLILLVAFVSDQRTWGRRLGAVGLAALSLAAVVAIAAGNEKIQTRLQDERNLSGRLATWERGLDVFRRDPVTGAGFREFGEAARQVPRTPIAGVEPLPQPHSSIVSTLAEQGLLGFLPMLACALALAAVLLALWRRAVDRIDRSLAVCVTGAALAYLVMSATLTMIYYGPSNEIVAVLVGLACGRLDVIAQRSSTPALER